MFILSQFFKKQVKSHLIQLQNSKQVLHSLLMKTPSWSIDFSLINYLKMDAAADTIV